MSYSQGARQRRATRLVLSCLLTPAYCLVACCPGNGSAVPGRQAQRDTSQAPREGQRERGGGGGGEGAGGGPRARDINQQGQGPVIFSRFMPALGASPRKGLESYIAAGPSARAQGRQRKGNRAETGAVEGRSGHARGSRERPGERKATRCDNNEAHASLASPAAPWPRCPSWRPAPSPCVFTQVKLASNECIADAVAPQAQSQCRSASVRNAPHRVSASRQRWVPEMELETDYFAVAGRDRRTLT